MYLPLSEPSQVVSDARSLWEVFVLWYNTCFCTWAWEVGTGLESQWSQTNVPSTTEAYVFSCPKLLITLFSLFRFGFCPVWCKWWFPPYLLCFFACLFVFSYDRQECRWTIRVLFESFFLYYQAWWDFLFVCFSFPFNAFAATQCFDAHSSSCDKMGGRDHFNVEKGTYSHYVPSSWSLAVAHL